MKFRVAREDLADAVAWVAKSLPARPPVPVLGGILLTVDGATLTVAGFDYEVSTRAEVSVDADTAGRVLVSGRLLPRSPGHCRAAAGRHLGRGSRVTIVGGSARFTLPTMPVEDYPVAAGDARRRPAPSTAPTSPRPSTRPRSRPAATRRCRCSPASGSRSRATSSRSPPPTGSGSPSASCPGCRPPADLHRGAGAGAHPRRRGQDPRRIAQHPGHARPRRRTARPGVRRPPHHRPAAGRRVRRSTARCCRPTTPPPSRSRSAPSPTHQARRAGHRPRAPPAATGDRQARSR